MAQRYLIYEIGVLKLRKKHSKSSKAISNRESNIHINPLIKHSIT